MIFLAISSGINIVLDLVFVLVFDMGVEGPAISYCSGAGYLRNHLSVLHVSEFSSAHASRDEWKPELHYMGKLCFTEFLMGLQYQSQAIGSLVCRQL